MVIRQLLLILALLRKSKSKYVNGLILDTLDNIFEVLRSMYVRYDASTTLHDVYPCLQHVNNVWAR